MNDGADLGRVDDGMDQAVPVDEDEDDEDRRWLGRAFGP